MRQYERMDCPEVAVEGKSYNIGIAIITANGLGNADEVVVFGNPNTKNAAWVPYSSVININGIIYTVVRGKLNAFVGNRFPYESRDQLTTCLIDEKGIFHDLTDYLHTTNVKIQKLETSKKVLVEQYTFDRKEGKLEYFVREKHQSYDQLLKKYIFT